MVYAPLTIFGPRPNLHEYKVCCKHIREVLKPRRRSVRCGLLRTRRAEERRRMQTLIRLVWHREAEAQVADPERCRTSINGEVKWERRGVRWPGVGYAQEFVDDAVGGAVESPIVERDLREHATGNGGVICRREYGLACQDSELS